MTTEADLDEMEAEARRRLAIDPDDQAALDTMEQITKQREGLAIARGEPPKT